MSFYSNNNVGYAQYMHWFLPEWHYLKCTVTSFKINKLHQCWQVYEYGKVKCKDDMTSYHPQSKGLTAKVNLSQHEAWIAMSPC